MNEIIFLTQTLLIIGFALGALRLGAAALTAWVAVQALVANLFVLKQITLFGLDVTASDAFAIGSILGLNFLQEYFGKNEAVKATWICFFFMLFFAAVSQLHLFYEPNTHDTTQQSFQTLLSPAPRLLFASMSVFFIVQQMDILFFTFLKKRIPATVFPIRAALSLLLSQLLDTVLFSFIGLYGIVDSVFEIMLLSFAIKLIIIFCFTPLLKWAKA